MKRFPYFRCFSCCVALFTVFSAAEQVRGQASRDDRISKGEYNLPPRPYLMIKTYTYEGALQIPDKDGKLIPAPDIYLRYNARPIRIEVTVDAAGMRRDVYTWESGLTSEKWFLEGISYETLKHDSNKVMVGRPGFGTSFDDGKNPLPELAGLRQMTMAGKERFPGSGRECYLFVQEAQPEGGGGKSIAKKIWLDAESGYPVGLSQGDILQTFEFKQLDGTVKLEMPAKFDRWVEANKNR